MTYINTKGGVKAIIQKTESPMKRGALWDMMEENEPSNPKEKEILYNARLTILHQIMENELTEKQRAVIQAVLIEGMTCKDWADLQGINKSSAHRCFWRAVGKIKKFIPYIKVIKV